MSKPRRIIPATELRVHLGDALKALEDEDIVVEKGGVPIALLTRYRREVPAMGTETQYERALSKRAEPGGWEQTLSAMERGWAGINEDEMIANIYRWREQGATQRRYGLDDDSASDDSEDEGVEDGSGTISSRQRHLQQGSTPRTYVADERAEYDASGRTGD
jgi:hypothetical protein